MKRLGLIGGSGWPSTLEYYRLLNTYHGEQFGASRAMDMIIRNLDFENFRQLLDQGRRKDALQMMIDGIHDCEKAGADFFTFSANGLHRFLDEVQPQVNLPCVHIAAATAAAVKRSGIKTVGLLGVKATMQNTFYPHHLQSQGLRMVVPEEAEMNILDELIFSELVQNKFTASGKQKMLHAMRNLKSAGSEGIILGCTEIPLLVTQDDFDLPLFATTEIHCRAILEFALA